MRTTEDSQPDIVFGCEENKFFLRTYRAIDNIPDSQERERIIGGYGEQEWLDLQKEVREFLKTATEEDRKLIGGYTESLCMICSAIKEGLL